MTTTPTLIERDRFYIGGDWVQPSSHDTIDVVNAATEEVMGRVPEGTPADVDRAVAAARDGLRRLEHHAARGPRGAARRPSRPSSRSARRRSPA